MTARAAASPSPSPTAPPNSVWCARCAAGRTPPALPKARCSSASGVPQLAASRVRPPSPAPCRAAIDAGTVARIVKARAAAGFDPRALGGYSLKRGALTTGMDRGVPTDPPQATGPAQELHRARRIPRARRPVRKPPAQRRAVVAKLAAGAGPAMPRRARHQPPAPQAKRRMNEANQQQRLGWRVGRHGVRRFVPGGTAARDWHRLSNAEGRIDTGHSLRAGLAELMRQTRHTSTEVALGYLCPICGAAMWPSGCFARVRWRKELLDF